MNFKVELSEQAEADLRNIFEHIALELQSIQNSSEQLSRLEKIILSLDQMPERFRRYDNEPWYSRGLRIVPVDNYCVFYIPDPGKKIVSIIRVMYGSRDIESELDEQTTE